MAAQPALEGDGGDVGGVLVRVCRATSEALGVTGASVTLMSRDGHEAVAAASGERVRAVAALEFSMGEGPGRDVFSHGRPVLVPDLAAMTGRWPGFASTARQDLGVAAVFAFPLHLGAARFGALSMYADAPRTLKTAEINRSLVLADLTTEVLLDHSATETDGRLPDGLRRTLDLRTEVFQAQGMVMVGLGLDLPQSLARIRAHAFAGGRDLDDVAIDIVAGRLILSKDGA